MNISIRSSSYKSSTIRSTNKNNKSSTKYYKINNQGFTLIELMITVAIVGILAAVALPAYQDYTIRAQVTEGLSLASGHKVTVSEYYSNHGVYPTMDDIQSPNSVGKYISGTTIGTDGEIIVTFGGADVNSNLSGSTLTLKPTEQDEGNLSWRCISGIAQKYLPTSCIVQTGSTNPTNPSDPNNPNDGSTPPPSNPSINFDDFQANYYNNLFTYENGIFRYNGMTLNQDSRDADGIKFAWPGQPSILFYLDKNGNFTHGNITANSEKGNLYFPNNNPSFSTQNQYNMRDENGNQVTEKFYNPVTQTAGSPYLSGTGGQLQAAYMTEFNRLSSIESSGQPFTAADRTRLETARTNFVNHLDAYKQGGGTIEPAFEHFVNLYK